MATASCVPVSATKCATIWNACAYCREELQRYRKLSMLLSRMPRSVPPADLAVRIKVAAAQAKLPEIGPAAGNASRFALEAGARKFLPSADPAGYRRIILRLRGFCVCAAYDHARHHRAGRSERCALGSVAPRGADFLADYPGGMHAGTACTPTWRWNRTCCIDVTVDAQGRMTKLPDSQWPRYSRIRHHSIRS